MRPILPPDIDLLTRVALSLPPADRARAVAMLLDRADLADRYRKRLGRVHPEFGDGSVHWLAGRMDPVRQAFCDAAYCRALATVAGAIRNRQSVRAAAARGPTQTNRPA
jgi:hypothetical protein